MKRRIKKGDSMEASYKHSYKTGENLLNSLSVYNVGYQKCDPEYQWGPGVRDHYCIHHILSGSGCYCTGTVSKHLEEGDTFILYPGVELRYQADADKPWEYAWAGFMGADAASLIRNTEFSRRGHGVPLWPHRAAPRAQAALCRRGPRLPQDLRHLRGERCDRLPHRP